VRVRGLHLEGFADVGIRVGNPQTVQRVVLEDLAVTGSENGFAVTTVAGR